jgi:hypothetical protein
MWEIATGSCCGERDQSRVGRMENIRLKTFASGQPAMVSGMKDGLGLLVFSLAGDAGVLDQSATKAAEIA